jgi:hypothetical protein
VRRRHSLEVTGLPGDEHAPEARQFLGTTRLEAFSDGVFAIAITLLVLDLALPRSGRALDRVLDAWPFYLAYVVSFLTIGAAWLAHAGITDRLTKADLPLLRINLLLLLVVALLPFPTRLVAEGLDDVSGERVFVTMYGVALLGARDLRQPPVYIMASANGGMGRWGPAIFRYFQQPDEYFASSGHRPVA